MRTHSAHVEPPSVKGWCPGALKPMRTGDGLIVRVRPRCGALQTSQLIALAEIALRDGNGSIDFTRRANLQLRGIDDGRLPQVWAALSQHNLIDASADVEAVRNVIVNPLAGFGTSPECESVLAVAAAVETLLSETPALWALPGKFSFVIDGGDVLPLDDVRADIRLKAVVGVNGRVRFALGVDTHGATVWLRLVDPHDAAEVAALLAREFLRLPKPHSARRMRDVDLAKVAHAAQALGGDVVSVADIPASQSPSAARVGLINLPDELPGVGLGAPLGRVAAEALAEVAQDAASLGIDTFRVSPWRAFYACARTRADAERLLAAAKRCGFVTENRDPLLNIDACPGAPACRSAWADTREAARRIARQMPFPDIESVHISGCTKGCARSDPADLVLVAEPGGFSIVRRGTATSPSQGVAPIAALDNLPALLRTGL